MLGLLDDRGDVGARLREIASALGRPESAVKRWLRIMRGQVRSIGATNAAGTTCPATPPDGEPAQDDPAGDDAQASRSPVGGRHIGNPG